MAISQTKYINIVSAVGGSSIVAQRDLMGRVFTTNYLVPAGQVVEFGGGATGALESIGEYFGITSNEYKFASKYFQENKSTISPNKISFAGFATEDRPAMVIGSKGVKLADLQAVTVGELTIGEDEYTSINLSAVTDLAGVATALTAVVTSDGYKVEYDSENGLFVLSTVATGVDAVMGDVSGSVATLLGWTNGVKTDGVDTESALEAVVKSSELSNNFFSFCFIGGVLSNSDIVAIAEWTSNQNVKYMFSVGVDETNAETIQGLVKSYDGVALTLDIYDDMAEFMPMSRIASVDYTRPNAAISMFYQQFKGVKPSVNETSVAEYYDGLRINYYGETPQAGQRISFYQNGVLQGSITDMGVFANEAWLKDSFIVDVLNLRLALDTLPANNVGVGLIISAMMDTVNQSIYNGVTLPGKTLDSTQKAYITQITGDTDAWMKVQGNGYYLTADVVKYTEEEVEKYKVSFLFVYSKGDSINFVDGRDVLI